MALSERERRVRQRLKDDFPHYAARCLRIRPKELVDGDLPVLDLNEAQRYLHARVEDMLARTGRVRVIIVKGRQQGCSTYVEGRLYWKVSHRRGARAYILTHEDPATKNLFEMAKTYHDKCPAMVKPSTGASNANELVFDVLGSGYKVGTAGSKGTGRSSTLQYFHGSEVAYWPNAKTHMAGVLQAVPDLPGTEVFLESTSAGPSGLFYEMAMAAKAGQGDYELVFIPWFWQSEYRKAAEPGAYELTAEEQRYRDEHGLDDGQVLWRRSKIVELGGVDDFRREYPATVEEAFKASAVGALWTPELLNSTRHLSVDASNRPLDEDGDPIQMRRVVVGVDPSGGVGNEAGLLCGGIDYQDHVYLWRDDSGKLSPDGWGRRAAVAYRQERADRVVGERNYGGDMVESTLRIVDPERTIAYKDVVATRGKAVRAEPCAALWSQGRAHICGRLIALEDEMTTWVPGESPWSPNRMDAAVWVVTELALGAGKMTQKEL